MSFIRPEFLWLLLLVPPLLALHWRHRMAARGAQAVAVTLVQALALSLLCLALARPVMERTDPCRTTVAVVDVSASVPDEALPAVWESVKELAARRTTHEVLKLVLVDRQASEVELEETLARTAGGSWLRPKDGTVAQEPGSSLAQALQLASARLTHDGRGRVVLYSDGLETSGDALAETHRLAERGITVQVQPLNAAYRQEVVLRSVSLPTAARVGETVELQAELAASQEGEATLVVGRRNGGVIGAFPLKLSAGRQEASVPLPLSEEGRNEFSVRIESAHDELLDNNMLPAAVFVGPPTRIGLVEVDPDGPANEALAALVGPAGEIVALRPEQLSEAGTLDAVELLVIADTPAEHFPAEVQERIRRAVTDGMGLLVTGGRQSFGPGGYADTPLAKALPVRFPQETERRDPSSTLVIIIDTSGSMGGTRVNLAKEIARLAIAHLKPHDKVGIVEFYGSKRWAAPIQPATNAIEIHRALNRLSAGGGTVILPAIEEAYYALLNVHTRTKHVLVLTDGGVETGAFEPVIRRMADHGMTLSTVLVGPGRYSAFLASLAHWGGGRSYVASDRFNLPEIIVKQPRSSLPPPYIEQSCRIVSQRRDRIIADLDFADAPPILGCNETSARPTADVLLTTELGHPLLVTWQYGLGAVAVFTSELAGEWAGELPVWPSCSTLFSNLARWLARPRTDDALRFRPIQRPGAVEIQIDNVLARERGSVSTVELELDPSEGVPSTFSLDPIASDRWNMRLAGRAPGTYELSARTADADLSGSAAIAIPPEREVWDVSPNEDLFAAIEATQPLARRRAAEFAHATPTRPQELWPPLVCAALLLFLLGVLMRRWPPRMPQTVVALLVLAGLSLGSPQAFAVQPEANSAGQTTQTTRADTLLAELEEALRHESEARVEDLLEETCRALVQRDGNLDAALEALGPLRETHALGARTFARVAAMAGDLESAQTALAAMTKHPVEDAAVVEELARYEELLGNDESALRALSQALAQEEDPQRRFALQVRQALLLYDNADRQGGAEVLRRLATEHSGQAAVLSFCAHLAGLCADYGLAIEFSERGQVARKESDHSLFRGQWLLRAGKLPPAMAEFERAYETAGSARDRRYALERMVATARQGDQLDALVNGWLADPALDPDRLYVLLQCLRELGRPDDALKVLRQYTQSSEQGRASGLGSWQNEIVSVAIEAGSLPEAEAACRSLLESDPDDIEALSMLARLLVMDDRRAEAVTLFERGVATANGTDQLMYMAEAAAELALDDVAFAAAECAGRLDEKAKVSSLMFQAELARRRGESDRAIGLLNRVCQETQADDSALLRVANAFERYGDKAEALRLLEKVFERTESEDVLLRMAWLTEENGQSDQALALWKNLWKTTKVVARVQQAQERILDLASRSGKLADVAIEAEEQLDGGVATQRTLSLLVEIYTRANDPVSATEILYEYGKRSGQQLDMLQRLARVQLACEQYSRCDQTLQRLTELDPANAADYIQQQAIIAVERNRPHDALQTLARLRQPGGDDAASGEFAAGVLDLVGLHAQAAREYARLLARQPDRIEAFLLWGNAMRAAGKGDRAIARFQCLLDEAAEDDLFTVAVDGLLNLDASPTALRVGLRRVYMRLAADPDKVFLYRLAADLLEAQGRYAEVRDVLELAVVVAGERRGPILRELMDGARADGHDDQAIYFGRSVLMLGEELPPQVFLDLGETMIRQGLFAQAKRAFDRACVNADAANIKQRVATYYENAGMPTTADRLIRELLLTQPDSVPLLVRSGTLAEQLSKPDLAFDRYERAVELMLQRLPAAVATGPQAETVDGAQSRRRVYRAANLDEITGFLDAATRGLLWAAQRGQTQKRLLDWATTRTRAELEAIDQALEKQATIRAYPRLGQWASLARRIAFSIRQPEAADKIDTELLRRFPEDTLLAQQIVRERMSWGLYGRAGEFVQDVATKQERPTELTCFDMLQDESLLAAALAGASIDSRLGACLVPRLITLGRDDQARQVLSKIAPNQDVDYENIVSTLLAAATALDDYVSFRRWAMAWVEQCVRRDNAEDIATRLSPCLHATWSFLKEDDRAAIGYRLARLADSLDEEDRVRIDLLRLRLANGPSVVPPDQERVLVALADDRDLGPVEAAWILQQAPAEERPGLLSRMAAVRDQAEVRGFLMTIAGEIAFSPDAKLLDTFTGLFQAAPKQRLSPDRAYSTISQGRWNRNGRAPKLGRRIADILVDESPFEPAVLTAAAAAYQRAGLPELAEPLMQDAIDGLLESKEPTFQYGRMLRDLIGIAGPRALGTMLAAVEQRIEDEGDTPGLLYALALLLDAADRREEAAAAITTAFKEAPTSRPVSRELIRILSDQGNVAELARLMKDHLTKSTIMESFEWRTLATLYLDLFEPELAMRATQRDESPLAPLTEMKIAHLTGDEASLQSTLSRFLTANRNQNRFFAPTWPPDPSPGGMRAFHMADQVKPFDRPRLFTGIADSGFAADDFEALLDTTLPDGRLVDGLAEGLATAVVRSQTQGRLINQLRELGARGALTQQDRRVLLALLKQKPDSIASEADSMVLSLLTRCDPADAESLDALAQIALARGDDDATRCILRWLAARDMVTGYSLARLDDRLERLDQYLNLLPEPERDRWRELSPASLSPTPLDTRKDALESSRIDRWPMGAGDSGRSRDLGALRTFLTREADPPAFRQTAAALARAEAVAGQWREYDEMVNLAFGLAEGKRLDDRVLDGRKVLPRTGDASLRRASVDRVEEAVGRARADGWISSPAAVRTLCLLGDWCVQQGMSDKAAELVEGAASAGGPPGEHWLWVADLRRAMGDESRADDIERRLLEEAMLPIVRVPPLLNHIESPEGQHVADALAVRVAEYSSHPEVLRRALRAAQRDGNDADAAAYRRRMALWHGAGFTAPPE